MFRKTGLFFLLAAALEVSARSTTYIEPDFIENVWKREEADPSSAGRIVSGWDATPGQHPHHAALRMINQFGQAGICGGTFISKDYVVTAAHCTAGQVLALVFGGTLTVTNPEYYDESAEWCNHPLFDNSRPDVVQPHDIGLIKLTHPVVYSDLLRRIRVQSRADALRNYEGEIAYASGHGRTWTGAAVSSVLQWVYLRPTTNAYCASLYGNVLITETSICAGFYNVTSQSTCHGDSGGPLVHVDTDGIPTLIGVTSFVAGGEFGCHSGLPAGFIRPAPYLDWFQENTGVDFENLQEEEDCPDPETPAPPEDCPDPETPAPPEDCPDPETPAPPTEAPETPGPPTEKPETPAPPTEEPEPETELPPVTEDVDDDESDEDDSSESSESDENDEQRKLRKRLQVNVKVKVKLDKYKHKKEITHEKEVTKRHHH